MRRNIAPSLGSILAPRVVGETSPELTARVPQIDATLLTPQRHGRVLSFGPPQDEATLAQANMCLSDSRAAAAVLMGDNHRGYSQPVGGVVAYRDAVSISGAGYDIGCGCNAARTNLTASDLGVDFNTLGQGSMKRVEEIMDEVFAKIEFGVGGQSRLGRDHPIFADPRWDVMPEIKSLKRLAESQLGTVGSGNHYVDLLLDATGRLWIANHFGSRGFGHKTASGFLNLAQGRAWDAKPSKESDLAPATVADMSGATGQHYFTAMQLAGEYAQTGRRLVLEQVASIMGADILETIENNHNENFKEIHDVGNGDETLYVARKGATPAFPGQMGFVGGSMGDDAVIVKGVDSPLSREAMFSTVHGAGRVLSRTAAAGKKNWKKNTRAGGLVTPDMMHAWLSRRGVVLRGGGTDESPQAYKRLTDVLKAHEGTVEIAHVLRPIAVAMAGDETLDPYKD